MDIMMKKLQLSTSKRNQMVDITKDIDRFIRDEKIIEGSVIVYVPHTTAGITINEGADPSVQQDIIETLEKLISPHASYHHSEGNSDAHIKTSLLGSSVTILVSEGKMVLGTWQHIFFYEGDGPRQRTVYITSQKNQ
jgi:secondary thiamine-phosphate synthase enzyme